MERGGNVARVPAPPERLPSCGMAPARDRMGDPDGALLAGPPRLALVRLRCSRSARLRGLRRDVLRLLYVVASREHRIPDSDVVADLRRARAADTSPAADLAHGSASRVALDGGGRDGRRDVDAQRRSSPRAR